MSQVFNHKSQSAPTLKDIARLAGTSQMAASVVLNGSRSSASVSEATRERILKIAEELRYSPNTTARGLKSLRHFALGVTFNYPDPAWIASDIYGTTVLKGILGAANRHSYNVTHFHRPWHDAKKSAAGFRGQSIDGFLVVAPLPTCDMVSGLAALGIPLVVISSSSDQYGVPSVDVDNAKGVRLVVDHLLSLGHRRIAHFVDREDQYDTVVRCDSFIACLAGAGVPLPPEYIERTAETQSRSAYHLLSLPEPPTAVFATNDWLAQYILDAARDLGIRVPEQLSVVGFDDGPDAARATPPLTTVRQPVEEMAVKATELLISLIEGKSVAPETYWFEPELIVRGSTAPPPA